MDPRARQLQTAAGHRNRRSKPKAEERSPKTVQATRRSHLASQHPQSLHHNATHRNAVTQSERILSPAGRDALNESAHWPCSHGRKGGRHASPNPRPVQRREVPSLTCSLSLREVVSLQLCACLNVFGRDTVVDGVICGQAVQKKRDREQE